TLLKRRSGNANDFDPYVFLLTDGQPDDAAAALSAAQAIRSMEVAAGRPRLIAIGLGDGVNMPFLQQVASNQELAKHLQKHEDLVKFFPAIGTVVSSAGGTQAGDHRHLTSDSSRLHPDDGPRERAHSQPLSRADRPRRGGKQPDCAAARRSARCD